MELFESLRVCVMHPLSAELLCWGIFLSFIIGQFTLDLYLLCMSNFLLCLYLYLSMW